MTAEEQAAAAAAAAESDAATAAEVEASTAAAEAQAAAAAAKPAEQKPSRPAGYVPVSEVVKERNKAKDLEAKHRDAEARATKLEQKETKRGFMREALSTLGESFKIEKPEALELVIENLDFNDKTKDVIASLIDAAKKPVTPTPSTPMFGTHGREQNKPVEKDGKYALWERMNARRTAAKAS